MKIIVMLALLTGCSATGTQTPETSAEAAVVQTAERECNATSVQYALGKKSSPALAQELMAKAGASILRMIPPRTAVTMDYNPVRLNISFDDAMVIDRISCG
jgi:Peptidase inhibitor I78 family